MTRPRLEVARLGAMQALACAHDRLAAMEPDVDTNVDSGADGGIAPRCPTPARDQRARVKSEFEIVLSVHALKRFGERHSRQLPLHQQARELSNMWQHVTITDTPPAWLHSARDVTAEDRRAKLWAILVEAVFPLQPHFVEPGVWVATTCLTRDGRKAIIRQTSPQSKPTRRRKRRPSSRERNNRRRYSDDWQDDFDREVAEYRDDLGGLGPLGLDGSDSAPFGT
ncbi:MAG: hypothetical protein WAP35_02125 [Solirubrobacterales bacterium]